MRHLRSRHVGALAVLASGALVLAACGGSSDDNGGGGDAKPLSEIKVAGVVKGLDNPFFITIKDGMEAAAAEYGIQLTVEAAPGLNDETGQANKLDTLAGQGFDCFVVIPISSNNLTQGLGKISQQGIPIVNIDSPVDPAGLEAAGGKINAFVGTDNTAAGAKGGAVMKEVLGEDATVGLVAGLAGNVTSNERIDGFQEGAAGMTFDGPINADWDTTKALDAANAMLASNPDISGFFAANDQMAQGIAQAVEQAGRSDIRVMGVDGIEAILADIAAGKVYGSVSQYPYVMGLLGVEACIVAAQGGTVPEFVESPAVVITPDNVDKAIADFPLPPEAYENPFATLIQR